MIKKKNVAIWFLNVVIAFLVVSPALKGSFYIATIFLFPYFVFIIPVLSLKATERGKNIIICVLIVVMIVLVPTVGYVFGFMWQIVLGISFQIITAAIVTSIICVKCRQIGETKS